MDGNTDWSGAKETSPVASGVGLRLSIVLVGAEWKCSKSVPKVYAIERKGVLL